MNAASAVHTAMRDALLARSSLRTFPIAERIASAFSGFEKSVNGSFLNSSNVRCVCIKFNRDQAVTRTARHTVSKITARGSGSGLPSEIII